MYFKVDEDDMIYFSDGTPLYRIIATEDFFTVNPMQEEMTGETIMVHKGDKGGYVSSGLCLEEKLGSKIKPWVFFSAEVVFGIISGSSVVYGDTKIYKSIIEGGCIVKDSNIFNSKIIASHYAVKDTKILISCIIESKSEIIDSEIKKDNVVISLSKLQQCQTENNGYGNIYIRNSVFYDMSISCDFEAKDFEAHKANLTSGIYSNYGIDSTEKTIFPIAHMMKNHEKTYNQMTIDFQNMRGIYKNVEYHPVC